jgi:hypothetical protein
MEKTSKMNMTMTMKQALASKPRDYVVCQKTLAGKIRALEPVLCGRKIKIKVFSTDGETEVIDGFVVRHTDGTCTFTVEGEEGARSSVKFEDFDLEHYVDMFFQENKNYNLYNKNTEGRPVTVEMTEETKEKIKVPFWHFLNPDNKLGRKFKKHGDPTTYYEFEFVQKEFRVEEYEGRNIIIKGYIQSGKSQMIIGGAVKFFSKGFSSLIVLRNSTGDADQLNDRLLEKLAMLKASLPPKFKDFEFTLVDKITEAKVLNEGKPTICVAIGNDTPLQKYREILDKHPELRKKLVNFVDEVDIIDSDETNVRVELEKIRTGSFCSFGISATVMDPVVSKAIDVGDLWDMDADSNYKGIHNLQRRNLLLPAKYSTLKNDNVLINDQNFEKFIDKFTKPPGVEYFSSIHNESMPKSVLCRVANTHDCNKRILAFVAQKYKSVPVMYYSGKGVILSLPEITVPIRLANGARSSIGSIEDDRGTAFAGQYHIFNKSSPSYVLQWLYENGGVAKFPNIIIFAGNLAARSISFGAANFKWCNDNNRLWWHLTHMYLTVADSMDEPELMQTAGRLCVVAKDSVPLRLFATAKTHEDLNKAYWKQEELLTRARLTKAYRDMGVAVQDLPIMADKFSSRSMTKKAEYTMNNKLRNTSKNLSAEKAAGGWSKAEVYNRFDAEGKVMKSKDADFEVDDFEAVFEEIPSSGTPETAPTMSSEREAECLKHLTGSSGIHKIVQHFVNKTPKTLAEIKEVCEELGVTFHNQMIMNIGKYSKHGYIFIRNKEKNIAVHNDYVVVYKKHMM